MKKRSKNQQRKIDYQKRVAKRRLYPDIHFLGEGDAPPAFVRHVKRATKGLFDHLKSWCPALDNYMQDIRQYGSRQAYAMTWQAFNQAERSPAQRDTLLQTAIGYYLFKRIPEEVLHSYLPMYCVTLWPSQRDNSLNLTFRSMKYTSTEHGKAYFAPSHPKVRVGDKQLVLAYSKHALQRIGERTVANTYSYDGSFDAFALVSHRDNATFAKWDNGISLWEQALAGHCCGWYPQKILGVEREDLTQAVYRYLCGYCACEEHRGFYVAKSFLTPGMNGTPEYNAWREAGGRRKELYDRAGKLSYEDLVRHRDFSLLKDFHHRLGIDQVRVEQQPVMCN